MKKLAIPCAAAILCLVVVAVGRAGAEVKLGSPYIDPVRGFSLRPPAGTHRERQTAAHRLVIWTKRKSPKAPILWRLSLYWRTEKTFKSGGDLAAFGRVLAARLAKTEGFKAPTPRVVDIGGVKAINLRGRTAGKVKFWQRRAWVYLRGSQFLEVRISGPSSDSENLDAIATAVLNTLKITDPKDAQAQRKAALARGTELLKAFTDKKLTAALQTEDKWFLYKHGDKVVGFMRQSESAAKSAGKSGYKTTSWMRMTMSGRTVKLKRELFTTADRSAETWLETAWVAAGGRKAKMQEKGSKTGSKIACELSRGDKKVTQKPAKAPKDNYLPRAMAWLLRRMTDLEKPAAYAFARYNGQTSSFHLRTFTVIGPEEIEVGGRKVTAVRVTDQLTAESPPADIWVDIRGNLLIMKTVDGLTMEAATAKAVARRFPKANETIKTMEK